MMWPEFSFPCNADKSPRQKEWQRGVFQNVTWQRAALVGAPTGLRNGWDALDIDPGGMGWYARNFGPQSSNERGRSASDVLGPSGNGAGGLASERNP
jgi:hypothetical protein